MISHETNPRSACPRCQSPMPLATCADSAHEHKAPVAGDLSVCFRCGCILMFNSDLTSRPANLDELRELPSETMAVLAKLQRRILARRHEAN